MSLKHIKKFFMTKERKVEINIDLIPLLPLICCKKYFIWSILGCCRQNKFLCQKCLLWREKSLINYFNFESYERT